LVLLISLVLITTNDYVINVVVIYMMLLVLKQHSMWSFSHIYISKSVNTWKNQADPDGSGLLLCPKSGFLLVHSQLRMVINSKTI